MLDSAFGAMVGYLTPVLPLVVIFQTWGPAATDRSLIEIPNHWGIDDWAPLRPLRRNRLNDAGARPERRLGPFL